MFIISKCFICTPILYTTIFRSYANFVSKGDSTGKNSRISDIENKGYRKMFDVGRNMRMGLAGNRGTILDSTIGCLQVGNFTCPT